MQAPAGAPERHRRQRLVDPGPRDQVEPRPGVDARTTRGPAPSRARSRAPGCRRIGRMLPRPPSHRAHSAEWRSSSAESGSRGASRSRRPNRPSGGGESTPRRAPVRSRFWLVCNSLMRDISIVAARERRDRSRPTKESGMSQVLERGARRQRALRGVVRDKGELALPPARRFAILTCMDARLDPAKYAGLAEGDAHVIRNAGGRASDDAIRSLVISYKLLGTARVVRHPPHRLRHGVLHRRGDPRPPRDRASRRPRWAEQGFHDVGSGPGSAEARYIDWLTIADQQGASPTTSSGSATIRSCRARSRSTATSTTSTPAG